MKKKSKKELERELAALRARLADQEKELIIANSSYNAYRDGLRQLRMDVTLEKTKSLSSRLFLAGIMLVAGLIFYAIAFEPNTTKAMLSAITHNTTPATPAEERVEKRVGERVKEVPRTEKIRVSHPSFQTQNDLMTVAARKGDLMTRARR